MKNGTEAIVEWLRQRLALSGARGFVFGLSGGIDSAVVAGLCKLASPGNAAGVLMPCHSDPRDEADAVLVADHFQIPTIRVDLAPTYDQLTTTLQLSVKALPHEMLPDPAHQSQDLKAQLPLANVKPRLRMTTLYFVANTLNYMVAGTGNRSELSIGYFTKYGDGGVDLLPIVDLYKFEIRALARHLGVPESVIAKPPSAGLWQGQTDESELGLTYDQLDETLIAIERRETNGIDSAVLARVTALRAASAHKRQPVPAFRRSSHNRSGDTDSPVR